MNRFLLLILCLLPLSACQQKADPAAAPDSPAAAVAEPVAPTAAAPAAEPTGRAAGAQRAVGTAPTPAPTTRRPAPAAAPDGAPPRAEWGRVLEEKVADGEKTIRVQSPWGPVTSVGPAEGPGETVVRYWAAWAKADFDAVYAFASGRMRQGLSSMDNPEGKARYADTIPTRYAENAVGEFRVDGVSQLTSGEAVVSVSLIRKDGTTEGRTCKLSAVADGWKISYISR